MSPNPTVPRLPKRTPFDALGTEIPDFRTSIPLAEPGRFTVTSLPSPRQQASPDTPATVTSNALALAPKVATESVPAALPEPQKPQTNTSTLVLPGDFRTTASRPPNRDHSDISRPKGSSPSRTDSGFDSTGPPQKLRSSTEKRIHARPGKGKKVFALAALVAVAGTALVGAGILFKDKKSSSAPQSKSVELVIPDTSQPDKLEPGSGIEQHVVMYEQAQIPVGETWLYTQRMIMNNPALGIGRHDPLINVIARANQHSAPQILNETAMRWLVAHQSDQQIANWIAQVNGRNDNDPVAFIDQQNAAVFNEMLPYMQQQLDRAQQPGQTSYQAPQRTETTIQAATEKSSVKATGSETILFLSPAAKAEALRKGRKAAAGLAKDRQNRQRQPSYDI